MDTRLAGLYVTGTSTSYLSPAKSYRLCLMALALAGIFSSGCSVHHEPLPAPAPTKEFFRHAIRPGESLALLAEWYTGTAQNWRSFYLPAATPGLHKLQAGDVILIPIKVAVRDEPPSEQFIHSFKENQANKLHAKRSERSTRPGKDHSTEGQTTGELSFAPPENPQSVAVDSVEKTTEGQPEPARSASPGELEQAFMEEIVGQ